MYSIHNKDSQMKYYIYWYKLKEHSDPYTEGYIGITKNIVNRHKAHLWQAKAGKVTHFTNAIKKYGEASILHEVLEVCPNKDIARYLEEQYRPSEGIGWNMATGGVIPIGAAKRPVTIYHKTNQR